MRLPDSEGTPRGRRETLVQSPDLMPTILELAGVHHPPTVQGRSLLPLIRGGGTQGREIAVSSPSLVLPRPPSWMTVTSNEWALLAAGSETPAEDELGRKIESELYHLFKDPSETQNVYSEKKEVADELRSKMIQFLKSMGTREEQLNNWIRK